MPVVPNSALTVNQEISHPRLEREANRLIEKAAAKSSLIFARTSADVLRSALYNVLNNEQFIKNHTDSERDDYRQKFEKVLRAQQKATDALNHQAQQNADGEWGKLDILNPRKWMAAWSDITSEKRNGLVSRAARSLQGGKTSEEKLAAKYITPELKQDIQDAKQLAQNINADYGVTGFANVADTRPKLSINKDKKGEGTSEDAQAIVDALERYRTDQEKFFNSLNNTFTFITDGNKRTFNLEQQKEQAAIETRNLVTIQQLGENTKKIADIVTNAPILKAKDANNDSTGLLGVIGTAVAAGGSLLTTGLAGIKKIIFPVAGAVLKLLTVGIGPLIKGLGKLFPLLSKIFSMKAIGNAIGSIGDVFSRRKRKGLSAANNKSINPTTVKQQPLTTKTPDQLPKQQTVNKLPETAGKAANTTKVNQPTSVANKTTLTTGSATESVVPKTVDPTKPTVKQKAANLGSKVKSNFKSPIAKVGGLVGAGVTLLSAGSSIADNNAQIDAQLAAGEITEKQASDLKAKQGSEIALSTAATGAGAWIGGVIGAIGGPLGVMIGSTVGSYAADALASSELGQTIIGGISDGIVGIKNGIGKLLGGDDDNKDVKATNNAPELSTKVPKGDQAVNPVNRNQLQDQVADTALQQSLNKSPTNIDASSQVNSVHNVTNNSEVVYNGMSATDNLGYNRMLSDPRIVGVPSY